MVRRIDAIVNGLIRLSGRIIGQDSWARERVGGGVGNVAQLEIFDIEDRYSRRLELTPELRVVDSTKEPIHTIRMHTDTMLALLSDELDFGEAYNRGLVEFEGRDYHVHAMAWSRAFRMLRGYIREVV